MILSICSDPKTMEIINIVIKIINVLKIVIPLVLLFVLMIRFAKASLSKNEEAVAKVSKSAVPNIIAAALIFLIPSAINLIVEISFPENEFSACFVETSAEKIEAAYVMKMEKLLSKVDETLNINDYVNAKNYLENITNEKEHKEYEEELEQIKEKIDKIRKQNQYAKNGYLDIDFGPCTFKAEKLNGMRYAICVPEYIGTQSIPMIVWLHGSEEREVDVNTLIGRGFPRIVRDWSSTGLKNIPAIIVAPIIPHTYSDWSSEDVLTQVKGIMDSVIEKYNVNTDKIALIGHSLGGAGTYYLASTYQDYFSSIVMMSSPKINYNEANTDYFRTTPIKGFCEETNPVKFKEKMIDFFNKINKSDDLRFFDCSHGDVPKKVILEDSDGDQISDIIYWMLSYGVNRVTIEDSEPIGDGVFHPDEGQAGSCNKHDEYDTCSPKRGVFGSFAYHDNEPNSTSNRWSLKADPNWNRNNLVSIPMTCSNGWKLDLQMHKLAKSTWEKVQQALCKITTTGIDGIVYTPDQIKLSGMKASSVQRFTSNTKYVSNHSYGTAIDVNPSVTYTIDGKKYTPYNRNKNEYDEFVKALGREDDPRNVNYILWKKIFEPLGFKWGGNWKGSSYDGMHFELNGGK